MTRRIRVNRTPKVDPLVGQYRVGYQAGSADTKAMMVDQYRELWLACQEKDLKIADLEESVNKTQAELLRMSSREREFEILASKLRRSSAPES